MDCDRNNFRWIIYCIVLLSGCTSLQPNMSARASNPAAFTVSGAIAAQNPQHAWTAHFRWVHQGPQDYQILIYGPLGADTLEITQHQNNVTYREGHKIVRAQNAEALLAKEAGIRLPVNHLAYWIKGNPAPGPTTSITRSSNHDIMTLKQAGYLLEYDQYNDHRPYKIRLTGHQLKVKIIIKEWNDTH